MQRLLDILLSGMALLVLSPLLVPVVLLLLATGEHEVFYVQSRVGRHGRPFGLYKFATMLKNSPNLGTGTVTLKDDPRVLPVGRVLRKTKLNELPQLLNVLKGDMSIVGPRPQTPRCFDAFPAASQAIIVQVRPGLSGIGSIVFRDEEELMHASAAPEHFYDSVIMPYKGRLEEWYVGHQGLRTYLSIIATTVWALFAHPSVAWRVFPDMPRPPPALASLQRRTRGRDGVYREVAQLHAAHIDQGFLATLGPGFLSVLYRAIDESPEGVLLVEEQDGRVVGFIAAAARIAPIYRRMLRYPFRLTRHLLPCCVRPRALRNIMEILRYSKGTGLDRALPEAELLSLVVAPQDRGKAVAEHLYGRLADAFRRRGISAFKLIVGEELEPAHRFYRRMGATAAGSIHLHRGRSSSVYLHRL